MLMTVAAELLKVRFGRVPSCPMCEGKLWAADRDLDQANLSLVCLRCGFVAEFRAIRVLVKASNTHPPPRAMGGKMTERPKPTPKPDPQRPSKGGDGRTEVHKTSDTHRPPARPPAGKK